MKICMVATGFPRFEGDPCGSFLLDLAGALVRTGAEVTAVCPHEAGLPTTACLNGVAVRRFRYAFPAGLQRLAYGAGIPTNIRNG